MAKRKRAQRKYRVRTANLYVAHKDLQGAIKHLISGRLKMARHAE